MTDIDEILNVFNTYEESNKNLYDEVNKLSNEVKFKFVKILILFRKTH